MPADQDFVDHCLELLQPLGRPRAKRMFGGHGIYLDERFIALVANGQLFLKADAQAQPAFEQAGSAPCRFSYPDGRSITMAYWSAPEQALDNPGDMAPWARLALDSALRAAASKPPAKPRKPRAAKAGPGKG